MLGHLQWYTVLNAEYILFFPCFPRINKYDHCVRAYMGDIELNFIDQTVKYH